MRGLRTTQSCHFSVQLRPYQQRTIELLRERCNDRPLLCLPTGSGKTSVAAEIIRNAVRKGNRCVFLVHRRELVDQAVARLAQSGIRAGRILAGHPERRLLPVQVASIPTLVRRKHWPAQLVIVDECAHATSASWGRVLDRYADAWVIGLTATPIRLDGRGLGDVFGCIVEPVTTQELIDQGYLVGPTVYAPPVDLSGVRKRAGDYALPELAERMNPLTASITETWQQRAAGLSTVVFAVNVQHSKSIVEAFCAQGVRAEHIDGGTAVQRRADTLARLAAGETTMVSNCMVLSEGWDLPSLRCCILARPTKSLALFRQMVGRVMRPPGPVVVLDHAGNHHEHGPVTDEIEWSLSAKPKRAPAPGVSQCMMCFVILDPGTKLCPECGGEVSQAATAEPPAVDNPGKLVKFVREDACLWYAEQVRTACALGYTVGWARFRYKHKYGKWPRFRDAERETYSCPGHVWTPQRYGPRRVMRCERCYEERAA